MDGRIGTLNLRPCEPESLHVFNTVLNDRWHLPPARLHENVQWANAAAVEWLEAMTQALAAMGSDAGAVALTGKVEGGH